MDAETTLSDVKQWVEVFVEERDWKQYHHPKELAISLCLESAELLENFQWREKQPVEDIRNDSELMKELGRELADVIIYAVNLSNVLGLDISEIVEAKLQENDDKYPADLVRGKAEKYTHYMGEPDG